MLLKMTKYNIDIINYINLFEKVTRAKVKGCYLMNSGLIFIVNLGEAGKAIGKSGQNIKRLRDMLKKNIKIVEFNPDLTKFVKNLIYPVNSKINKVNENTIEIEVKGAKAKEMILGRKRENFKDFQQIVSDYFSAELKVI